MGYAELPTSALGVPRVVPVVCVWLHYEKNYVTSLLRTPPSGTRSRSHTRNGRELQSKAFVTKRLCELFRAARGGLHLHNPIVTTYDFSLDQPVLYSLVGRVHMLHW